MRERAHGESKLQGQEGGEARAHRRRHAALLPLAAPPPRVSPRASSSCSATRTAAAASSTPSARRGSRARRRSRTADDVVVLSGWARVPGTHSEAELMRAAWRGAAREVVVDPDARTTVENMANALNDVLRVGAREVRRRHVVVARAAREGGVPLAAPAHRHPGAVDVAAGPVAARIAPRAGRSGRSCRSSSGPSGGRAGAP